MLSSFSSTTAFSSGWREILEKMEQSLTQVEAAVFAREREHQRLPVVKPNLDNVAQLQQQLDARAASHTGLDDRVQKLDQAVKETCALLQSEENALRQWLSETAALCARPTNGVAASAANGAL